MILKRKIARVVPRGYRKLQKLKQELNALRVRRKGGSTIKKLAVDLTYECSLSCITCRCPDIAKSSYKKYHSLSLSDLSVILYDFKKLGGKRVEFSGGEPFLHKEIGAILATAKGMGFSVGITSNHTLINTKNALYLSDYVDNIIFSLDGPSPEVHDVIRGQGAFKRAIEGRKILYNILNERGKENIAEEINCTISRYNCTSMIQMVEFAKEIGIKSVRFNYLSIVPDEIDKKTSVVTGIPHKIDESHWSLDPSLFIPESLFEESRLNASSAVNRGRKIGVTVFLDTVFRAPGNAMKTGKFSLTKKPVCNALWDEVGVLPNGSFFLCPMLQHYCVENTEKIKLLDFINHPSRIRLQEIFEEKKQWLPICHYCCRHSKFTQ